MAKISALVLLLMLSISGLIMIESANAQTTTKLYVPEFTVTYSDHSYEVPVSTSIDPFTGKTVENPSHHVENRTLTFTIKNQTVTEGQLHYVIRMKGHFAKNWTGLYDGVAIKGELLTVWVFSSSEESGREEGRLYYGGSSFYLPSVGQVDFQVKAQTWGEVMATSSPQNIFGGSITTLFAESDWSNTQTINLVDSSVSISTSPNSTTSSNPTTAPNSSTTESAGNSFSVPLSTLIVVILVLLAIIGALSLLLFRRYPKSVSTST